MVIVDEKAFMNPPPYLAQGGPPPYHRRAASFSALPSHLLLKIVYMTFPQLASVDDQRKTLYWLSVHLRLVNRAFFISCMHILRSTYLPAYQSLVRPFYTSDPFPVSSASPSYTHQATIGSSPSNSTPPQTPWGSSSSIDIATSAQSVQRETQVLDNFIALKVREDVWADDSELHLERDESVKDLFDFMQPRSRLEDLVRHYGMREGFVCVGAPPSSRRGSAPLQFSDLSVTYSPRSVGLVLMSQGRKRTIAQVARTKNEKLEYAAKRLVKELGIWLTGSSSRR